MHGEILELGVALFLSNVQCVDDASTLICHIVLGILFVGDHCTFFYCYY